MKLRCRLGLSTVAILCELTVREAALRDSSGDARKALDADRGFAHGIVLAFVELGGRGGCRGLHIHLSLHGPPEQPQPVLSQKDRLGTCSVAGPLLAMPCHRFSGRHTRSTSPCVAIESRRSVLRPFGAPLECLSTPPFTPIVRPLASPRGHPVVEGIMGLVATAAMAPVYSWPPNGRPKTPSSDRSIA